MLALTTPLKTRLQALPQLTGWAVRTGTEDADRRVVPAADVRCVGAAITDRKQGAVMVAPDWQVTLVVRRGASAAELIDEAVDAVISSLHGWRPPQCGGRGWEALSLSRITELLLTDEGYAGYELTFTTAGLYTGQQ